ncbi:MAG: hypothetical protein JJU21_15545 [Salinarimonas sp.]|nr:hypothetical protein [Salinarimonas sp.]
MKTLAIASVSAFALLLAACGDDQTAQQNGDLVEGDTAFMEQDADPAPTPEAGSPPDTVAGEPAGGGMGEPVMPGEEEGAGTAATEAPAMQSEPDADERLLAEEAPDDTGLDATGSIPDQTEMDVQPGVYESGLATMRVDTDGSYVMELNEQGEDLAGTDRLEGNVLAAAQMDDAAMDQDANCVFSPEAGGLRVTAGDPSCAFLDGEIFRRAE